MSRVAVKICGVTEPAGAALAAALGADFLGLNFWPGSPRHLDPARARDVAAAARAAAPGVLLVGVFVNPTAAEIEAATIAAGLDLVQLSGDETPAAVRALPYRTIKTLRLSAAAAAAAIAGLPPAAAAPPPPPVLAAAARSGGAMPRDSAAGSAGWEMLAAGFEECWGLLFDTPRDLQAPRHPSGTPPVVEAPLHLALLVGTPVVAGAVPGPGQGTAGTGWEHGGGEPGREHGGAGPGREPGDADGDQKRVGSAADYGGTGRAWNHGALAPLLAALPGRRVFVAGGLGPGNVRQVVASLQPFAIDVCSAVESAPGRKDPRLLRQLFEEIGDGQVTSAT